MKRWQLAAIGTGLLAASLFVRFRADDLTPRRALSTSEFAFYFSLADAAIVGIELGGLFLVAAAATGPGNAATTVWVRRLTWAVGSFTSACCRSFHRPVRHGSRRR